MQRRGPAIGNRARPRLEDQEIGPRERHLLERQLRQRRPPEPPRQIDQPDPREHLVDERPRPRQIPLPLIIGRDAPAPRRRPDRRERAPHLRDHPRAALGMADRRRKRGDRRLDRRHPLAARQLEQRQPLRLERREHRARLERRTDHQIGPQRHHFLSAAMRKRQVARLPGDCRKLGIARPFGQRDDLVPIRQTDEQLVGAQIKRDDPPRHRCGTRRAQQHEACEGQHDPRAPHVRFPSLSLAARLRLGRGAPTMRDGPDRS